MKKGLVVGIVCLSLVLIISINFVSAGLLGDVWGKITGRTTENETATNETNVTEQECPQPPISMWCPDGITLCPMITDEQGCSVWDCDSCEPEPEPEICVAKIEINFDKSTYNVGEVFSFEIGIFDLQGNPIPNYVFYVKMYDDRWHTPGQERTGADGYFRSSGEVQKLPSGATSAIFEVYTEEVGACNLIQDTTEIEVISKGELEPIPPEPRPEPRPEICAAKISINFDKNVYYIGEEFKAEIGIFDSQGNPVPNYPFYINIYDYEKGMWHTSSQEDRTDGSGYKIHQDKMNVGEPFRFGKNKFRIFTEVSGCNLVEDIAIIEIKRKEGPESIPCGMGSCVPEEDEEVEDIPDERGFYSCSGCEADEKCYPMGYRKTGEYCTPDNVFVSQIDGGCDNSFECKSNVCISGECLTEGFIEKIMNWFKKLFGGEEEEEVEKKCSKLLLEHNIGEYKYAKSVHGEDEHTKAPLFSEDGEHLDTIKCCAAIYKDKEDTEHGVLFCPYDSKEDVTNSVKWLIAKERDIVFKEYENEKVFGDDKGQIVAWINNAYLIAVGVGPAEKNIPLPEDIANAYLKKYSSEFELTEEDIPDAPPERPWVYCTEEDEKAGEKCVSQAGARLQTDPHPDNKDCEVYVGCIFPYEKCESIDDIKEKEDCYVGVAEMTGDSSVCKEITSDESRRNKCYVKAAETSKDASICEKITYDDIKKMCFELVEVFPWESCKSEEDMSKEECHFTDDFESGLGNWVFSDAEGKPNTAWWSTIVENGNTVFEGIGHNWAVLERKEWDNYIFKTRFKIIKGAIHFNYRRGEGPFSRYFIGVESDGVSLKKQIDKNFYEFDEGKRIKLDQGWHTIEIRGYGNILNIYIDDELLIKYKDTKDPLLSGGVAFETLDDSEFLIDDVEIKLITEEEIIYP